MIFAFTHKIDKLLFFFLQAETARRVLLNHISSKQVSLMDLVCWLSLPAGPLHLNSQASLMHTAQQLQFSPVLFNTTRIKANCFCYVKKKNSNSLPVIKHYPRGVHKVIIFLNQSDTEQWLPFDL